MTKQVGVPALAVPATANAATGGVIA